MRDSVETRSNPDGQWQLHAVNEEQDLRLRMLSAATLGGCFVGRCRKAGSFLMPVDSLAVVQEAIAGAAREARRIPAAGRLKTTLRLPSAV